MQLAKAQVQAGDLAATLEQLEWAKSATKDAALAPLPAVLLVSKLSKVNLTALTDLEAEIIWPESWKGRVAELRGELSHFVKATQMRLTVLTLKLNKLLMRAKRFKSNLTT